MALNYSVCVLRNPQDPDGPRKAYARAQVSSELSLKEFSKRVASQTTVSRADVSAVLIAAVDNLLDALREGYQVDFGELGKFRLQIESEGVEDAEKFTSAQITGVNVQFVPGDELQNIFNGLEFNPVPTRAAVAAVLKAQKLGQTTVDISSGTSGGSSPEESSLEESSREEGPDVID